MASAMRDLCKTAELAENILTVLYVATFECAIPQFPRATSNQQPTTNNQQLKGSVATELATARRAFSCAPWTLKKALELRLNWGVNRGSIGLQSRFN